MTIMAKPIGPKTALIRDAIKANPDKGNTELANLINSSDARKLDKITVTANDIAQQKQALKNLGKGNAAPASAKGKRAKAAQQAAPSSNGAKKQKRKPGRKPKATTAASSAPVAQHHAAPGHARPVELLSKVFDLAQDCGAFGELKQVVDRLAELPGR
jgi:hypothetical protein